MNNLLGAHPWEKLILPLLASHSLIDCSSSSSDETHEISPIYVGMSAWFWNCSGLL